MTLWLLAVAACITAAILVFLNMPDYHSVTRHPGIPGIGRVAILEDEVFPRIRWIAEDGGAIIGTQSVTGGAVVLIGEPAQHMPMPRVETNAEHGVGRLTESATHQGHTIA